MPLLDEFRAMVERCKARERDLLSQGRQLEASVVGQFAEELRATVSREADTAQRVVLESYFDARKP